MLCLARDNSRWGYGKIAGELQKLGHHVSTSTVRNVLKAHNILPAPVRFGSIGWRTLMLHYKHQLLACDFFTMKPSACTPSTSSSSSNWVPAVSISLG